MPRRTLQQQGESGIRFPQSDTYTEWETNKCPDLPAVKSPLNLRAGRGTNKINLSVMWVFCSLSIEGYESTTRRSPSTRCPNLVFFLAQGKVPPLQYCRRRLVAIFSPSLTSSSSQKSCVSPHVASIFRGSFVPTRSVVLDYCSRKVTTVRSTTTSSLLNAA